MLFLIDENSCFQCFCTEKYEKCVRPDKDFSLKAALQGRENKIKRLLCRNLATGLTGNRATKSWGQPPFLIHFTAAKIPYPTTTPSVFNIRSSTSEALEGKGS